MEHLMNCHGELNALVGGVMAIVAALPFVRGRTDPKQAEEVPKSILSVNGVAMPESKAPIPREELTLLCQQARKNITAEWEGRVALFARNQHSAWWRVLLRLMNLRTVSLEDLVVEGREMVAAGTYHRASELWNGSYWVDHATRTVEALEALATRSTGDVYVSANDLQELLEYAESTWQE